jgi:hypothetical protein
MWYFQMHLPGSQHFGFSGVVIMGFLKDGVKTYPVAPISPPNEIAQQKPWAVGLVSP